MDPATAAITLVAGNGSRALSGDGLPAPSAALSSPGALTFDPAGNLYIADRGNFAVRRVDALSGVITTIAGTGLFTGQVVGNNPPAPLGDGGSAVAATFGNLGALVVDGSGAVVVCDSGNACVRRFTIGGTIATIAGVPGSSGFTGDGVFGGALAAKLNAPTGVAIDGTGAIFIADSGNRRVRRLSLDATVTTVAGSGTGGNTGFTGDGDTATNAQIGSLGGITFDAAGQLVLACIGANRIRRVDVAAVAPDIVTIAGNGGADVLGDLGPATGASLSAPRDVAFDLLGNILVLDAGHRRIRRVDLATGSIDTIAGTGLIGFVGDRGPNQGGVLADPSGAAFDAAGNLYVADTSNNAVRRVAPDGTVTTFAGDGTNSGLGDGGPAALATLAGPHDVCVAGTTLFIADFGNDRVRAVDLGTGLIRTYASVPAPVAIVANAAGTLFVAHDDRVDLVDLAGNVTPFAGDNPKDTLTNPLGNGLPATNATLSAPSGLALNAAGEVFIADTGNNLIRKIGVAPGRIVSTVAGGGAPVFPSIGDGGAATSASLNAPVGVAVDATRILIADTGNHRIRSVVDGVIGTVCGTGTPGLTGDGDLAAGAEVNQPGRMSFHGADLVFADTGNNRIRRLVTAIDIDPSALSVTARFSFAVDKKTGQLARGRDTVGVRAALALPDGISTANLAVRVDIVDLHQATQFDANGKPPRPAKPAPPATGPFDFTPAPAPASPTAKYGFSLKGVSVAGGRSVPFAFSAAGTLREELGRAGFTDVTTATGGVHLPVRVNITLGAVTFTGLAATTYKARQGRTGAAVTVKPH
jgi:sugar lactone lactonase YvrE